MKVNRCLQCHSGFVVIDKPAGVTDLAAFLHTVAQTPRMTAQMAHCSVTTARQVFSPGIAVCADDEWGPMLIADGGSVT